MQCIPEDKILKFHPDTMMSIRKEYNLDKPGMMEDAIRILKEWIKQQEHFIKKDFGDTYLERIIIVCKGSLERSKKQIDQMCTLRTLLPQFFKVYNPKTDFGNVFDVVTGVILPNLTAENYRVFISKVNNNVHLLDDYFYNFVYNIILGDYLKAHDYSHGFIIVLDFTATNLMDILAKTNVVLLRQALTIMIEGYGMRIKGIYFYTSSKLIDTLIKILKQVISAKVASRIHHYKTLDNLSDIVPVDILPEDYGGKERSMKSILADWIEILSSEENLNYLKDINQAGTDESCRQVDKFNDEYAGMPGTFRLLSVD